MNKIAQNAKQSMKQYLINPEKSRQITMDIDNRIVLNITTTL